MIGRILGIFFLFLLLSCCMKKDLPPIASKQMENILFDVYVSDAAASFNREHDGKKLSEEVVKQKQREFVYQKYGVTEQEYDSSIVWLGKHLDEYLLICDRVEQRLNAIHDKLVMEQTEELAYNPFLKDSVDLIRIRPFYSNSELKLQPIQFDVSGGSHIKNGDTLCFVMNVMALTEKMRKDSVDVSLSLHYENDSVQLITAKIDSIGEFQLTTTVDKNLMLMSVQGKVDFKQHFVPRQFIAINSPRLMRYYASKEKE